VDELPKLHLDPALEGRIAVAVGIATVLESCDAKAYGSSMLNRTLRSLKVPAANVVIVSWLKPSNADARMEVYKVPNVAGDALGRAFRPYFENRFSARWEDVPIAGVPARSCEVRLAKDRPLWATCWCAIDGFALSAGRDSGEESATSMLTR